MFYQIILPLLPRFCHYIFVFLEKRRKIRYTERKTGMKPMSEHALKNEFISVSKEGLVSYGGNQTWSENAVIRKCGCGVISSLDLLLYLGRHHCGGQAQEAQPIPLKD